MDLAAHLEYLARAKQVQALDFTHARAVLPGDPPDGVSGSDAMDADGGLQRPGRPGAFFWPATGQTGEL
jgi:hypothetical protein